MRRETSHQPVKGVEAEEAQEEEAGDRLGVQGGVQGKVLDQLP